MDDKARDKETGISIRFIQSWKGSDDIPPGSMTDMALILASRDDREISTMDKIADALAFLKSRIH